jgi:uncharacterized protein
VTAAPFHLAFAVTDLASTRAFYVRILGCREGRSTGTWVDFDFFGHQLSAHVAPIDPARQGAVDGKDVPIPHFGVVLGWEQFHELVASLRGHGQKLDVEPTLRFPGQIGEQVSVFLRDPSGNALEFKAFRNAAGMFDS